MGPDIKDSVNIYKTRLRDGQLTLGFKEGKSPEKNLHEQMAYFWNPEVMRIPNM